MVYIILTIKNQPIEQEAVSLSITAINQVLDQQARLKKSISLLDQIELLKIVLTKKSITFKGNPNKGIQVMGVLETRGLDFDNVIITSLNEGILPAGKSNNSFIPFDVKREFGLPTTKEKDAIYAYHFYRLIKRAKHIHLIYNSDTDALGAGEKSRFISQLEHDENLSPFVTHKTPVGYTPHTTNQLKSIPKTAMLMADLNAIATKGFSPSALATYIRNPYLFYQRYVLKIDEAQSVKEQIAPNDFGTIVHDSLHHLYLPLIGQTLSPRKS